MKSFDNVNFQSIITLVMQIEKSKKVTKLKKKNQCNLVKQK